MLFVSWQHFIIHTIVIQDGYSRGYSSDLDLLCTTSYEIGRLYFFHKLRFNFYFGIVLDPNCDVRFSF